MQVGSFILLFRSSFSRIWVIHDTNQNRFTLVTVTTSDKPGKWRWWFVHRAEGLKIFENLPRLPGT